jgi:hypothetical protein
LTLRRKRLALASAAAALVILQITAPAKTNPPVDSTKALSSMSAPTPVIDILRRSCFDCHSSETRWPWYASVAPMSWLVVSDVNEGRGQLNFSKWTGYNPYDRADLLDKICDNVSHRRMPLWQYRLVHPTARLSDTEVAAICTWTKAEAARVVGAG